MFSLNKINTLFCLEINKLYFILYKQMPRHWPMRIVLYLSSKKNKNNGINTLFFLDFLNNV